MASISVPRRTSNQNESARRALTLTWTLAVTDWKLRFYGSALGYLWSLARPFALFGVIYLVFSEFANIGNKIPHYSIYILFSIVLFNFFGEVAGGSVGSLVARENLLRKVRFPRIVIPASVALGGLFNVGMTLVAVVVFALLSGVYPTWRWIELPFLVAMLGMWAAGIGMALSALFVRFRDIQPIWDVAQQSLFYASPVLYAAAMIPERYKVAYMCNPIATVLTQMRHAIIDPTAPSAADVIGGMWRLSIPVAIVVVTFLVGLAIFRREAPRIAENL